MRGLINKPIHGEKAPLYEHYKLKPVPPVPCDFCIGDRVIFTNEYGLKFDMDVIGFADNTEFYGRFIHIVRHGSNGDGSAWWFAHKPDELKKF